MHNSILRAYQGNLDYAHRLVEDVEEKLMCDEAGLALNHPAWILGHLSRTSDFMATQFGASRQLAEAWDELFGPGTLPLGEASRYPDKAALLRTLADVHACVEELLCRLEPDALRHPPPQSRLAERFGTLEQLALHVFVAHERTHLGQLSAWRRVHHLPRV